MFLAFAFVLVVATITSLVHLYLWKRLVRDTMRPGIARKAAGFAILALALLVPATFIGSNAGVRWLAWPGYLWLALMFYLLVILAIIELPTLIAKLVLSRPAPATTTVAAAAPLPTLAPPSTSNELPESKAQPDEPPNFRPDRRLLLARGAAITAGLLAIGITGYGVRTALGPPALRRVQIPLAKLDRRADGLRIALVSDIHLGPILGRAHTERVVSVINSTTPDVVAIVGDMVDGTVAELGAAAAPLADLRARYGSFFVTGNHEYFTDGYVEWVDEIHRLGVRPLRNERVEILHRGAALDLAGVNDVAGARYGDGPDFARTLGDRDTTRAVVLLAHQPIQVREAARYRVDLQLSGHTHGGQIYPFHYIVGLQQPILAGLGSVDGTTVFVTRGAGFWGPPVRVGAPPEIVLIELRAT